MPKLIILGDNAEQEVPSGDHAYCHFRDWSLNNWLMCVLAILAVGYTLYATKPIVLPVAVAVTLAFLLSPVARRLGKIGLPDWISAGVVLGTCLATVVLVGYSVSGPTAQWINSAPEDLRKVERKLHSLRGSAMQDIDAASEQIKKITDLDAGTSEPVFEVREQKPSILGFVFGWTGSMLIGMVIVVVLAYFLLAAKESTKRAMMSMTSDYSGRRGALQMALEIERSVSTYLFTMTIINIFLGIAIGTTMWLLGLPNPVLWGVMAALLNYAPYVGPGIGAVVVGLVALLTFDSVLYAALAPISYLAWNTLEGQFLTPAIMGRWMKINPLAILLSIIFWGGLWGAGGVLLAVPMLTIGLIALKHIRDFVPQPQEKPEEKTESTTGHREAEAKRVLVDV